MVRMSLGRCPLPDDCGCPVSLDASFNVCSERGCVSLAESCQSPVLFSNFEDLASLTKIRSEMLICRTKFGFITYML